MRKKLKSARVKKGFTQKELAEKAGIHRAHYTNIELGKTDPSLKVAMKIKKVLDIENDNIFFTNNVSNQHKNHFKEVK